MDTRGSITDQTETYRQLRQRAIARIEHEDRLFSDRLRNYLMAAAFLLGASMASSATPYLRMLLAGFGLVLSYFYLHIGVRSCQGIRLWRVTLRHSEQTMATSGTPKVQLPDEYIREPLYSDFRSKPVWRVFIDTNALQGLWVPASGLVLWFLLLGQLLSEWRPICAGSEYSTVILWSIWTFVFLVCLVEILSFRKDLATHYEPSKIGDLLK